MSTEMQYLALTDAMGYRPGPEEQSPVEYAEALRKDAERYRWLRDRCSDWDAAGIVRLYAGPDYSRSEADELDQQIDAAMLAYRAVGAA